MKLEDLKQSITQMNLKDTYPIHEAICRNRMTATTTTKTKKKKEQKETSKRISKMKKSPEELKELLRLLGEDV